MQFWNELKINKIRQLYEKNGCHANSNDLFQPLNQDFSDDLHVGGCEGVIYFYGKVAIGQISGQI